MVRRAGVDMSGPFFRRDPKKTFRKNLRDFMDEVAELGEADVVAQLRAGEGRRASIRGGGRVSQFVQGRTSSIRGKRWAVTAVVSVRPVGDRKRAVAIMAAAAEIEAREHVFRRTTARLRKARTNLVKGLT
jgi:hypothetical protein